MLKERECKIEKEIEQNNAIVYTFILLIHCQNEIELPYAFIVMMFSSKAEETGDFPFGLIAMDWA